MELEHFSVHVFINRMVLRSINWSSQYLHSSRKLSFSLYFTQLKPLWDEPSSILSLHMFVLTKIVPWSFFKDSIIIFQLFAIKFSWWFHLFSVYKLVCQEEKQEINTRTTPTIDAAAFQACILTFEKYNKLLALLGKEESGGSLIHLAGTAFTCLLFCWIINSGASNHICTSHLFFLHILLT